MQPSDSRIEPSTFDQGSLTFELGRTLGRTRAGQGLAALSVVAFFGGLAFAASQFPKLAASALSLGLLVYGFQTAWRLLPIPVATRERWAREERIAARCPAYPLRGFLWMSLAFAAMNLFRADGAPVRDSSTDILLSVFLGVGLVGHVLCQRFVRKHPTGF